MAEKILTILRQQKTEVGLMIPGVAYRFDLSRAEQAKVAKVLLDRGFAKETTAEELKKQKQKAETLSVAAKGGDAGKGGKKASKATKDEG